MGKSNTASRDHEQDVLHDLFPDKREHPVEKANWLSFATFYWMGRLMNLAYRQGLTDADVPEISNRESCKRNTEVLERLWAREIDKRRSTRPSFSKVAWQFSRGRIFFTSIVYILSLILGFITPTILMKKILLFARDSNANRYDGLKWVSLLILCEIGRVFFFTLTWALSYRTAIRLKTASMGLLYRKLLRVGNITDQVSAKLLNVISGDCGRLYEVIVSGQVSIGGPIVLLMSSVYIWYELGWMPMLGLLTFVLAYPLQYFLAKGTGSMKRKAAQIKDERISLVSQSIQHFKFLKMFGWEKYLFDVISGQLFQSFSVVLGPTLPHIAAILTFLIYICSGNLLLPDQAFCIITVYISRIRPTLMRIRAGFRAWFDAKVAVSRIQAFVLLFIFSLLFYSIRMLTLLYDSLYDFKICSERMKSLLILSESKPSTGNSDPSLVEVLITEDLKVMRQGPIDHRGSQKSINKKKNTKNINSIERLLGNSNNDSESMAFQLGPIDLRVKKGSFVGICGYVGSGKTTFLEALVASLKPESGKLVLFGKTAYVPQHPWLFKGTIRDNITFGEEFDSIRYYNSIDSCCLTNDFAVLPIGDLTRVDNNGSTLSGGQRQRISLARALYYGHADIYLLDDPLSGLDNRVAKSVFDNVIMNKFRKQKKTVILVTHQLQFLKECDEILVFADGKIVQRGVHQDLIGETSSIYTGLWNTSSQFSSESQDHLLPDDCDILDLQLQIDVSAVGNAKKMQLELEKSRKDVAYKVFLLYIRSAGGWLALFLVILTFTLSTGSVAFSSWWLKHWFKKERDPLKAVANNATLTSETEYISSTSSDFVFNRDVYEILIGIIFLTGLFRSIFFVLTTMRASKHLHRGILRQFFCNRMKTLEKLGVGQVFNLFSRDIGEVDGSLPNSIENLLQNIFIVFTVLVLVSGIFPTFLIFAAVVFVVFAFYRRIYNTAIRDLKRIESSRRSPIFTRISETVKGLGTIRAFNKEKLMTEEFEKLTDSSNSVSYAFSASVRWLAIRLDTLAVVITGVVASLIFIFHGAVSAAAAGLALSYAAQLSGIFQFTARLASETEAKFVSVERMQTFLSYDQIEHLGIPGEKYTNQSSSEDSDKELKPPEPSIHPNWPTVGHVKFSSVTLSYSSNDAPVLREVSFEVQAGQNIGIIGRTGSGKSSIGNALFRLTELKSGSIFIDGVDISTLSLPKLRHAMCVIPQDPSVFQRSIRFNLDAGKVFKDHELWTVLEKTGLKASVDNLDSEVGLSHGQKQLLCIARALLRQSKIIFIDECTSNMDMETAAIVEKLIAEEFKYSTVFIVAHRTSALSSCDSILIMGDGEVKDFGPVDVLSKKPEFKQSFEKFESVALE